MHYLSVLLIVFGIIAILIFLRRNAGEQRRESTNIHSLGTMHEKPGGCCGQHETCQRATILAAARKIDYYEDEELDRFQNRSTDEYVEEDEAEFREVLFTMRPEEVSGWLRSLSQRNINPPVSIQNAARLIQSHNGIDTLNTN